MKRVLINLYGIVAYPFYKIKESNGQYSLSKRWFSYLILYLILSPLTIFYLGIRGWLKNFGCCFSNWASYTYFKKKPSKRVLWEFYLYRLKDGDPFWFWSKII